MTFVLQATHKWVSWLLHKASTGNAVNSTDSGNPGLNATPENKANPSHADSIDGDRQVYLYGRNFRGFFFLWKQKNYVNDKLGSGTQNL